MSSTPQNEFDSWYSETHHGTKATWEDDDGEIPDYDVMTDEETD